MYTEPDRVAAIRWVLAQGRAGDVLVLAGKGHETYQEVMGVTHHMDEREIVADYFREQGAQKSEKDHLTGGKIPVSMIK